MNETRNLAALIGLIAALSEFEAAASVPQEPTEVNGMILVPLVTGNEIYDEGVRQHNALIMPQMRSMLLSQGKTVWSMRDAETDVSILSLSVDEDGVCRHVVAKHNAAPSADQLDTLYKLLDVEGIELQYSPFTLY